MTLNPNIEKVADAIIRLYASGTLQLSEGQPFATLKEVAEKCGLSPMVISNIPRYYGGDFQAILAEGGLGAVYQDRYFFLTVLRKPELVAEPIELAPVAEPELAPLSPVHPAKKPYDFRPTEAQFTAYQSMFDYYNQQLFGGLLPQVILNFSRKAKAGGFFAPSRWEGQGKEALHEISLNPDHLSEEPLWTVSVLVHEMAHLQRQITGKPPRGGYHDKEWGQMMLAVGLTPVSLDKPGTMVGQRVTHEIDKPGAFWTAWTSMPNEYLLPFTHIPVQAGEKKKASKKAASKTKYSCPVCETNIWGKPGLNITCSDCEEKFEEEEAQTEE